ncbi:MAG: hypothetical protein BroJett021_50480 [Chloroflexota bacterium]|nr:hypothetical protein [Caldilinea sp.]GIK76060.1 MAG: hypothetical protein BroJett021_50480 [Chloroflexota bacterium]
MNQAQAIDQSLLRQTVVEVASLPDDDLAIVLDVVAFLKRQRAAQAAADIRQAARQRAVALRTLPREELATQLRAVGETIRRQAIAANTAIEGDWEGD